MEIYLAEKPDVGLAIAKVINPNGVSKYGYIDCGNDQYVTWCIGHLMTLKDPDDFDPALKKWNLEQLPMVWPVEHKPCGNTSSQLKTVVKLLRGASRIINCTDIDAAGQAISDEIFSFYKIPSNKIFRALINDNNPKKVAKALEPSALRPNSDFYGLYLQELARSVGDQRVGYNLTRLLTLQARKQGYNAKLNCGRVQSSMLGLVVRRQRSIASFVKQNYYNVNGEFLTEHGTLKGRFSEKGHNLLEVDEKGRLTNSQQVKLLASTLHGQPSKMSSVELKTTSDSPPLPYDLLSLQIECSRLYGLSPDEVLTITQKLRESPFYAITYNRSDSRYIPDESFPESPAVLKSLGSIDIFSPLAELTDSSIRSRAFNSQKTTAHGSIIPTGEVDGWGEMDEDMKAVFLLIARNYMIQFLPKRQRRIANYCFEILCPNGVVHHFYGRVQRVLQLGWASVFCNDDDNDDVALEDEQPIDVDALSESSIVKSSSVSATEQTTSPLGAYTMTTLLKDLKSTAKYIEDPQIKKWMLEKDKSKEGESGGIGTAATRSSILRGLFDNGFLEKNSKSKVVPTEKGELLFNLLPNSITSPDTTAVWSHYFNQIADGEMTIDQFWIVIDRFIEAEVITTKKDGLNIPSHLLTASAGQNKTPFQQTDTSNAANSTACPKCRGTASRMKGKWGWTWRCNGTCNSYFPDLAGSLFYKKCPKCKKDLKIMKPKGRGKTPFISCSGYPECTHKEPID
ncbi:DNA topoisomerase [Enterovibrio norvegicus]|uniref:DNA topoisomerase n=1 Tax=Enterovibrio norvegicus TaxID=188144 RepID=UPI000C851F11|nr:DNA topoisomerase [Enterovibrio norvegicus]PMH64448.1 hypothetical protein BCU62_15450 [Enterovibrio norvegicus]